MKIFRTGLVAVGLGIAVLAGGATLSDGHAAPKAPPASELDVEIAIDGTGSMASAIAQVKASGVGLTDGLVSLLPNTRFAVVVFRDHGNPAGTNGLDHRAQHGGVHVHTVGDQLDGHSGVL